MESRGASTPADVDIRPLRGAAELEASVELQKRVWGAGFTELIPVSMLEIVQQVGGVAIGAFVERRLVGLLFGISGIRDRKLAHWSDTLAVLPEFRDHGIGRKLKWRQREILLAEGVERIHWTFDPLESRNAYMNLARLGAVAVEYRRDFYGVTASALHEGMETDRLVAAWDIGSDRVARYLAGERAASDPATESAPIVNPWRMEQRTLIAGDPDLALAAPAVRLVIPADMQELKARAPEAARRWRHTTRAAFEAYLGRGYTATDLRRAPEYSYYLLERTRSGAKQQ